MAIKTGSQAFIPTFPVFDDLKVDHQAAVQKLTKELSDYSCTFFGDLWAWNTDSSTQVSVLNDNLVVKQLHYQGNHLVLSFYGTHQVDETIEELLNYAEAGGLSLVLDSVPSPVVDKIKVKTNYKITESEVNNEYVLDAKATYELSGGEFRGKRKQLSRLQKQAPDLKTNELDSTDKKIGAEIHGLIDDWAKQVGSDRVDPDEKTAIDRVLRNAPALELTVLGCRDQERLVAFGIVGFLNADSGIVLFEKVDVNYPGLYTYLGQYEAKYFLDNGREFVNIQQDLGIEGLRTSKSGWKPAKMLKKYDISR